MNFKRISLSKFQQAAQFFAPGLKVYTIDFDLSEIDTNEKISSFIFEPGIGFVATLNNGNLYQCKMVQDESQAAIEWRNTIRNYEEQNA